MTQYTDQDIASKVEMTQFRWGMGGLTIAFVSFLAVCTFSCADSRLKDSQKLAAETQITSGQKVECVKAGGSWMPIQGVQSGNAGPQAFYEMGCVSAAAQAAIIAQNNKVIETFKPTE